jgi:hypothetical protein
MRITLSRTPEVVNKGKYNQLTVQYEADGKTQDKKIMSFTFKEVYNLLAKANVGDSFDISMTKNDKGYWDWTEAKPVSASGELPAVRPGKSTGSWETAEERAQKQVYIMRQSCLGYAVNAMGTGQAPEEYTSLAEIFFQYVLNGPEQQEFNLVDEVM